MSSHVLQPVVCGWPSCCDPVAWRIMSGGGLSELTCDYACDGHKTHVTGRYGIGARVVRLRKARRLVLVPDGIEE